MWFSKILGLEKYDIITPRIIKDQFSSEKEEKFKICSGSKTLDELLGKGFWSGRKYLIFGRNSTGKTQLCHQLCIQAFLMAKILKLERISLCTYYIDTENTFRPERIVTLAASQGLNVNIVLKSIYVSKVRKNYDLLLKLKEIEKSSKKGDFLLLIIDSINNHYRSEVSNDQKSFNTIKNDFLNFLSLLNQLTLNLNIITIATAQVTPNFVETSNLKEIPASNNYLNHFFSEYIYLEQLKNKIRNARLVNSQYLPERETIFSISEEGIKDV